MNDRQHEWKGIVCTWINKKGEGGGEVGHNGGNVPRPCRGRAGDKGQSTAGTLTDIEKRPKISCSDRGGGPKQMKADQSIQEYVRRWVGGGLFGLKRRQPPGIREDVKGGRFFGGKGKLGGGGVGGGV